MSTTLSPEQEVFRDVLIRILNIGQPKNWDEFIEFAPRYHVDVEDEEMFRVHVNEQIGHAAEKLKADGVQWTGNFEALAKLIEPSITEIK